MPGLEPRPGTTIPDPDRIPPHPGPRQTQLPRDRSLEHEAGCFPIHPHCSVGVRQSLQPEGTCPPASTGKVPAPGQISFQLWACFPLGQQKPDHAGSIEPAQFRRLTRWSP